MIAAANRLRRHEDFQRVYKGSRKRFGKQMSYFFLLRRPELTDNSKSTDLSGDARVGLTVPRALGKAVDRNRIKRRMREAAGRHIDILPAPVDVVLHPKRSVIDVEFSLLERDIMQVFTAIRECAIHSQMVRAEAHS